jgi:hypothetical protein
MDEIVEEIFWEWKWQFAFNLWVFFNLQVVFNLQNGLTKIASRLFLKSFSPKNVQFSTFESTKVVWTIWFYGSAKFCHACDTQQFSKLRISYRHQREVDWALAHTTWGCSN